jgi:outer membrane protein assembly factor BamB
VHRGKIYQPTGAGNLLLIDGGTGRLEGRLKFGEQRLATTPATDADGRHMYLLGEEYILYIIALGTPPRCASIIHLGHRPDSITASPLRMGRYLVLCENDTAAACRLRVLLLSPDGASTEELQSISVNGWVHHTPSVSAGNLMFVATDLESVEVYSAGPPEKADGFSKVTSALPSARGGEAMGIRGQAYPVAYSDRDLLVAASKIRHYDFKAEQASLNVRELAFEGAASQPIQRSPLAGRAETLVVTRRIPSTPSIALLALHAGSLEQRWEVVLNSGLVSLFPLDETGSELIALTRTGAVYLVPSAALQAGGVLDQPASRMGAALEFSGQLAPVLLPDRSTVYAGGRDAAWMLVRGPTAEAPARRVELPASLQAPLVAYRDGVLAAVADGRIYWISPVTGKQLVEPFQPSLNQSQPLEWRGVAVTDKSDVLAADRPGSIYQLELRQDPVPHIAPRSESRLPKPLRSGIATLAGFVCGVDDENTMHTIDVESLAPIGQWPLPAPASLGPVREGNRIFVVAGQEELVCVGPDGQEAWRYRLEGAIVAGIPLVREGNVYVTLQSGLVRALRLDDGTELWTVDAEKPLSGGAVAVRDMLIVAGDDGSLNVLRTPVASQ